MKHLIIRTLVFCALTAAAAFAATTPALAQTQTDGNEPITVDGCRPLLAPDCVVDDVVNMVSVISGSEDYSAVLDANLTNSTSISASLANIDATVKPIISIRDINHKYKAGQTVGFVVGGGAELLSLDLLSGMAIMFYDNGDLKETVSVDDGGGSNLLSLNLLAQSGSQTVTATAPCDFDKIALAVTGANITALSSFHVFYGFVGDGKSTMTGTGFTCDFAGISIGGDKNNIVDTDLTNGCKPSMLLGGNMDLKVTYPVNEFAPSNNVEVGFVCKQKGLISVDLLQSVKIVVKNTVTNEQHEYNVGRNFIGIDLAGATDICYSVRVKPGDISKWNQVELKINKEYLTGLVGELFSDFVIYYAYVKEFDIPEEAERCDLNLSADALICASEPSYTLTSDEEVTWTLTEAKDHENKDITNSSVTIDPADNAAKSATVTFGTSPAGVYTFTATHAHDDGTSCTGTVTITRGKTSEMGEATANAFCGTPLDATANNVELGSGSGGGLIVIDGLENADNIIDGDLNSYASYAGGLQIADNTCIVKVSKTDGSKFDKEQAAVVGFVAETPAQVLGANVLTFYRIVLYNGDEEVYNSVAGENNAVNVSLIGAPGSGMVRYAITVPDDVPEFDGFALYTSGVLNLNLTDETMKIYNAFTADDGCVAMPAGPLDHAGVKPISIDDGAKINYKYTGSRGLASVVSVTEGLGYLVDNELTAKDEAEQGVTAYTVAGVLNDFGLAVKTGRRYSGGRWVGLVMKKNAGLADVSVLSDMEISLYDNNISTGDEENAGIQLLSTNVIGWGDYAYLTVYTDKPFDEVRFKKGQLVETLSGLEYLGFYTYADADGDGIPDEEDPDFCGDDTDIEFGTPEVGGDINGICASNPGEKFTATVTAVGAKKVFYTITDIDRQKKVSSGTLTSPAEGGEFTQTIQLNDPKLGLLDEDGVPVYGRYEFKVTVPEKPLLAPTYKTFTIHAAQTTWNPQIEVDEESTAAEGGEDDAALYRYSTDWNKWENWTQGVPVIGCTDVIIPGENMQSFPVLEAYSGSDKQPKDFNSCENIHFMAGAEVQGTEKLDYEYASVDFNLASGRYYMLSTPLKATYAGDFFIPANMNGSQSNNLFEKLDEETSPENRFSPRVYQRLWMQSAPVTTGEKNGNDNVTGGTDQVLYDETRWTPPFNGLTQQYGFEQALNTQAYQEAEDEHSSYSITGFSLKADAEDLPVTTLKFRLPKEHEKYYYYNEKNQQTDLYEIINRNNGEEGKLYTDYLKDKKDKGDDWEFPITLTTEASSTVFIAGNPFMAHINIAKFFKKNTNIKEVKVYDGNAMNSAVLCDGELLTNNNGKTKEWTSIAPMQSFFVTVEREMESCKITYTEDMLETQPNGAQQLRIGRSRAAKAESEVDRLTITASTGDVESNALVRFSGDASADFVPGEDAALLVDNEVRPRVQVFTIAGNRAADIQQTPQTDRITLGFMLAEAAPLTLSLSGDTDWNLYDTLTGATYSLAGGQAVSLGTAGSSTGRYMLVRPATDISTVAPAQGIAIRRTPQGTVTITSADGTALGECAVYSADGTLTGRTNGGTNEVELNAAPGISIVKATKADGTTFTQKIY